MKPAVEAMKALLARFARDTGGSIAIMWGLSAIVVIGMVGAAIDYSRAVNVKEVMAQELDGAVLAGARYLSSSTSTDKTKTQIVDTFSQTTAQALGETATYELTADDISISEEAGTISATAKGAVQTAFMKILGIDTMPIEVTSQASFSDKYLEIALVLDVTGSMDWSDGSGSTRIASLKSAATALINTLMPDDSSDRVRISIIPYSEGVRLSSSMASSVTNGYSTRCATERTGDQEYTDANYTVEALGNGSGLYMNMRPDYWTTNDLPDLYTQKGTAYGACPYNEILPLTNDRSTLLSKINSLSAISGTAGQTGITWGWYTLSPNWNDLWDTDAEASNYDDDETLKYVIIMTDGEFNAIFDKTDVSKQSCSGRGRNRQCTTTTGTYWYELYSDTSTASADRAKKVCAAMKNSEANQGSGITIYSVYFNPDSNATAEATMESCATDSDKFTYASNGQALTETFVKYAQDIQKLYLSK
ncbi:TadE/TadG family type IV pilus assembly protein [Breoghania corrubedonensis]|nr:TadE/TadG family type IV pilus assembly protein [Breoghania corrubedonensis]